MRGAGPNGPAIAAMIGLAMAFFLNPVPEMIYLGRSRSFELLLESARFVFANPVAWFLPNLVFAVILLAPTGAAGRRPPGRAAAGVQPRFSRRAGWSIIFGALPYWTFPLLLLFCTT